MAMATRMTTTVDAYLNGRLMIEQPARGYRAGLDAMLLATSLSIDTQREAIDIGAGVGTVGLCVAAGAPDVRMTLVERAPLLADLAARNITRNNLHARAQVVVGDIAHPFSRFEALAHRREQFDVALMNPPYFDDGRGTASSDAIKGGAHSMEEGALEDWVRFAATVLKPGGQLAVIHRTEALGSLLASLGGRFGAVELVTIHPQATRPANRILVRATKASRAPLRILPALVVHEPDGSTTARVEAATRNGTCWL
jgi:tRNA1(Val) A37 N6-methylase TrmN6